MSTHRFASYRPQRHFSEDILCFEDTFDTDSLKNFYQKQVDSPLQVHCFTSSSKLQNDDDNSLLSPDDRETQASPLVRYINRFNGVDSVDSSYLALHLSYPLFSNDSEAFEKDFYFNNQETAQKQRPLNVINENGTKPAEGKKIFEMKGNLSMTVSSGNITLNGKSINQIQPSKELQETNFERLIKMKKIFKIEKDTKSKVSPKLKFPVSILKSLTASPQIQTVKVSFTALRDYKGDSLTQRILFKNEEPSHQKKVMFNFTQKN